MSDIRLPYQWEPRPYQRKLWHYLSNRGRRAVTCWPRRSGKDETFLHHTACSAHERVGNYWYMLPEYSQARKSMWDAINPNTGRRRIDDAFPQAIRKNTRENEMSIVFHNGSTFQLVGSDNFNSLVGSPPVGLVFSEYALSNPSAWAYLQPIIEENNGWVGFNSTPRGKNHFHNLCTYAEKAPTWFYELLTNDDTRVFNDEQLEEILASLQAVHGDAFGKSFWLQEYFCSFDAAIPGSIWGDCIDAAQQQGRISTVPVEPGFPVFTGWDLGRTDDTVIWFFQVCMGEVRVLDYHSSNMKDIPFYADLLQERKEMRGFTYGTHWLPHDARPRTLAAGGKSILQQFNDLNDDKHGILGKFAISPRLDREEGIQAARATMRKCWFDGDRCKDGIEALRHYHRTWDEEKKTFSTEPVHDWCLTGDTTVLTRDGTYQIIDLPDTGEVLTSCGWKPYINPRITRINAPLVEVRFVGGYTVRCTPDHPFLTVSGWRFAESLLPTSQIQSSLTLSLSISMAVSTVCGRVKDTCLVVARSFIGTCGELLSELCRMVVISTTLTGTQKTTRFLTLSAFLGMNTLVEELRLERTISRNDWRTVKSQKIHFLLRKLERRLRNGTSQKKEDFGIGVTWSESKHGQNGQESKRRVSFAESRLWALKEKLDSIRDFVRQRAKPLRIESVKELPDRSDVWCLTVPGYEEFSLGNGAIVHNSSHAADAFRTVALSWRSARESFEPQDTTIRQLLGGSIGAQTFGEIKKQHLEQARARRQEL